MDQTLLSRRSRDRVWIGFALGVLAALTAWAWVFMADAATHQSLGHDVIMHHGAHDVPVTYIGISLLMWVVMMVAMMLPGASPMILTYATVARRKDVARTAVLGTSAFVSAYLVVWAGFSVLASVGQWALYSNELLDGAMGRTGPLLGAALLVTAGVFQRSALKEVCLSQCRTPLSFVLTGWRDGVGGAFMMGLRHGAYCVGCCWALMLLMFVGGVMSLIWMGGLALFMLVEKVVADGRRFSRRSGLLLVAAGLSLTLSTLVQSLA
jgi:predicted metal-binding membrane protein